MLPCGTSGILKLFKGSLIKYDRTPLRNVLFFLTKPAELISLPELFHDSEHASLLNNELSDFTTSTVINESATKLIWLICF